MKRVLLWVLAGCALGLTGCAVVPVGASYGYGVRPGYVRVAPAVVAPPPVVIWPDAGHGRRWSGGWRLGY